MSLVGFPAAAAFFFAALTAAGAEPPERAELLRLVNAERESRGLALLRVSPALTGLAQTLAEEEAAGTESPQSALLDRAGRAGYEARLLTQITATANGSVAFLFSSWRERRGATWEDVVREDFRDAGVGTARRSNSLLAVLLLGLSQADDFAERTLPLADTARVRAEMLGRVNSERRRAGASAVRPHPLLDRTAQQYAARMVEKGFYGHTAPEGDTVYERVSETGYRAETVSENLARGQFSVTEVMQGWMGSDTHRRNILSPLVREAGFGVAKGKSAEGFQVIWVQVLARPRSGNPAPWPRRRLSAAAVALRPAAESFQTGGLGAHLPSFSRLLKNGCGRRVGAEELGYDSLPSRRGQPAPFFFLPWRLSASSMEWDSVSEESFAAIRASSW